MIQNIADVGYFLFLVLVEFLLNFFLFQIFVIYYNYVTVVILTEKCGIGVRLLEVRTNANIKFCQMFIRAEILLKSCSINCYDSV